jgi:4-amino-4-deoxy-L-arabinose transferase-like glycosyltransferase
MDIKEKNERREFPPYFSHLIGGLILLWGAVVFGNYYSKFLPDLNSIFTILNPTQYYIGNMKVFIGHFLNLALSLLFIFAHFVLGRMALSFLNLKYDSALEEIVFSIGAGFGLFANYIFLISALGALSFAPALIPLFCLLIYGFWNIYKKPLALFNILTKKMSFLDFFILGILILAMLFNLMSALSPEVFYDALVYHLAVPNYYIIHEGIRDMPYNIYSNLPMLHGMLYAAGLLIKDEFIGKLINYFAGILTVLAILAIALRYYSRRVGLWAGIIFYTIVQVMSASCSLGTEMLLTFFSLLAVYAAINSKKDKAWFFVSAFFSGTAMAVKYTGVLVSVGVMAVYFRMEKKIDIAFIKKIAVFIIIAGALVSPWLIKNYIYRSNPVYPFMTNVFKVENPLIAGKIKGFMAETSQGPEFNFKKWISHPWAITMGNIGSSSYFSPLFLFLLPLVFLMGIKKKNKNIYSSLTFYFFIVWVFWSFFSTRVRFLMPVFPIAAILIADFVNNREYVYLKNILRLMVIFSILTSCFWAVTSFYTQERWKAFFGQMSKDDFLSSSWTSYSYTSYPALNFINKELPADSKILITGDARSFYIKRDFIASSVFDLSPISEYAKHSESAKEMLAKIKRDKITHILLNVSEAKRLEKNYAIFNWNNRSSSILKNFLEQYTKTVFVKEEKIKNQDRVFFNRLLVFKLLDK